MKSSYVFLNSDEIARDLDRDGGLSGGSEIAAARLMLERVDAETRARRDVIIETTLASRTYAQRIKALRPMGYVFGLVYLRLPTVEASIERVRRRVAAGGHAIPEVAIRRRFSKSLSYFDNIYKPLVDEWYVWESLEGDFRPVAAWDVP